MENSERKEKVVRRQVAKVVERALEKERNDRNNSAGVFTVIGPKGGIGKSLLARVLIDRHRAVEWPVNIVQIDRTPLLPDLYGDAVAVAKLPSTEEMRADPLSAVVALEPLANAIEASLNQSVPLIVDVGGGPSAATTVEYLGKARVDAYLQRREARSVVCLVMVADPATMAQSIDLGHALEIAYPSAKIICVLNERDGKFKFFPGSLADRVWRDKAAPFLFGRQTLHMPSLPAGALAPFDALGFTFTEIINSDEAVIAKRLGVSRAIAATLQGDVSEWFGAMWAAVDEVLKLDQGDSNV